MKNFQELEERLAVAGSGNAKRAIEELAAQVLHCKPLEVYFRDLTPKQQATLEKLIIRAERGEPIQYIIGNVGFRGLKIHCDRRALIPRPETELLVQSVLDYVHAMSSLRSPCFERDGGLASTLKIADVGCGTGCISLALLHELPNLRVTGMDISPNTLALARENAKRLRLSNPFQTLENHLLDGLEKESLNIVVSNPPYIPTDSCNTLDPSVRDFEPRLALNGGEDGLALIYPLIEQAAQVLKPGGSLFLEIGYDQGEIVSQYLKQSGFQTTAVQKDYSGLDRIVWGKKPRKRIEGSQKMG